MRRSVSLSVGLLGSALLLTACGMFKVTVNGEEKTLGGEPTPSQTSGDESSDSGGDAPQSGGTHASGAKSDASDLKRATRDLIGTLDKALMADDSPLPEDKLGELEKKRKALADQKLADDAAYVSHLITYYRVENAFRGDAAARGDTLAKLVAGAVTTKGDVSGSGKPVSFKFKAEAGKCYTVFSHLKKAGGDDDRMSDFFLDAGNDNASLQRFTVRERTTRGAGLMRPLAKMYTNGACATKNTEVTASMMLSYAGTKNGLDYVVVEHARDKFPTYIALEAEPMLSDGCDVDGYTAMWTNPLPGSVVYGGSAPFVPYDVGPAEEMWMTAWDADGGDARLKREDLATDPPKQLKFDKDYKFKGCPKELKSAHSPDGIRVAKCWDALDKRYNPQFDAAQSAKSNAVGILAEVAADERLTRLNDAYTAEADRTCEKMSADVGKKMSAAYDKVVDFYQSTPYKAPFDRAGMLRSTYKGVGDLKCIDAGSYCSL